MLLGEILRRLSGKPLDEYAADSVFRPLGMKDTMFRPPPALRPRIAPTEHLPGERPDGLGVGGRQRFEPAIKGFIGQEFLRPLAPLAGILVQGTGTKNAASTDIKVVVDSFIVGTSTIEETSPAVQYNEWRGASATGAFGGSYRWNPYSGASAQFKFSGTSVTCDG